MGTLANLKRTDHFLALFRQYGQELKHSIDTKRDVWTKEQLELLFDMTVTLYDALANLVDNNRDGRG